MAAEIKFEIFTSDGIKHHPDPETIEPGDKRGFEYLLESEGPEDPATDQKYIFRHVLLAICAKDNKNTLIYDVAHETLTVDGLYRAITDKRNQKAKKIPLLTDLKYGEPFIRKGKTMKGRDFSVEINHLSGKKRKNSGRKYKERASDTI